MNRPAKISAASQPHELPPSGVAVRQEASERLNPFPGNHPQVLAKSPDPTGGAVKPVNASTLNDGYGTKPRCLTCGRGQAGCICNMPDPEPEYFRPGLNRDPDRHWIEL